MTTHPTFSVIIPTYNSERFIERTLKSVLHQTFSDFELILVDDGSNDKTKHVLDQYANKDKRIKVITTPNSGGPTVPTNIGITASKGQLITFLDHDDEWKKDKLQKYFDVFCKNPTIGFIASNVEHINDHTGERKTSKLKLKDDNLPKTELLAGKYFNTFSMLAVRRSVLDRVGALDTNLKVFADFDIISRMIVHNIPYQFLEDAYTLYHHHGKNTSSITTSLERRVQDLERILEKYEKTFLKNPRSYSHVLQAVARLHLIAGNRKHAFANYRKAIQINPYQISNYAKAVLSILGDKAYARIKNLGSRSLRKLS